MFHRLTFDVTGDRSAEGTEKRSFSGVRLTEWLGVTGIVNYGFGAGWNTDHLSSLKR